MSRSLLAVALGAIALIAAPPLARACDPETMEREITEICRAAVDPAAGFARAVLPSASAGEARAIEAAIIAAGDACEVGDPAAGARKAVELARLVGRIEARGARPASTL